MSKTKGRHRKKVSTLKPVGLVMLDDTHSLGPQLSPLLQDLAPRLRGIGRWGETSKRTHGAWPFVTMKIEAREWDETNQIPQTNATIRSGVLRKPMLRISAQVIDSARLMNLDPAAYFLNLAALVAGGEGKPSAQVLERVSIVSSLCAKEFADTDDLMALHTGTAFEPAFLYDASPYRQRLEERVLPTPSHLISMVQGLPKITRVTIVRDRKGVPVIGIAPYVDHAV